MLSNRLSEVRSSAGNFSLGDLAIRDQSVDARLRKARAVVAHALTKGSRTDSVLRAEGVVIARAIQSRLPTDCVRIQGRYGQKEQSSWKRATHHTSRPNFLAAEAAMYNDHNFKSERWS